MRARLPSASALRLCSLPLGQDITPPELVQADATCSRSIVAFGYVRGTFLKPRMRVHVPGLGDFSMGSVTGITDPCPFPSTQKRRRLNEREKLLHAPMANLGELTYDADAVYVDIPDSAVRFSDKPSAAASKSGGGLGGGDGDGSEDGGGGDEDDEDDEGDAEHAEDGGVAMVKRLHKLGESSALNSQLASGGLRLFAGGAQLPGRGAGGGYEEAGDDGEGDSEDEESDDDEEEEEDSDSEDEGGGRIVEVAEGQQILDDDDDDGSDEEEGGESDDEESDEESDEDPEEEEEEEEEGGAEWKSKLLERAAERYNTRRINWSRLVYGEPDASAGGGGAGGTGGAGGGKASAGALKGGGDSDSDSDDEFLVKRGTGNLVNPGGVKAADAKKGGAADSEDEEEDEEEGGEEEEEEEEEGADPLAAAGPDAWDGAIVRLEVRASSAWTSSEARARVIDRFVTGKWADPAAGADDADGAEEDEDDEMENEDDDGGFEDLETGEVVGSGGGKGADGADGADDSMSAEEKAAAERMAKKVAQKAQFDSLHDRTKHRGGDGEGGDEGMDDADEDGAAGAGGDKDGAAGAAAGGGAGATSSSALKPGQELFAEDPFIVEVRRRQKAQRQVNLDFAAGIINGGPGGSGASAAAAGDVEAENAMAEAIGFRPGTYVRIVLNDIPCEFVEHFDPCSPFIVGGLLPAEERLGVTIARVKKHRWHKKILKTNDPLVFSLGWRRFQSLPVFATKDANLRMRHLKYTPEHMHCLMAFYGPTTPPNTGTHYMLLHAPPARTHASARPAPAGPAYAHANRPRQMISTQSRSS